MGKSQEHAARRPRRLFAACHRCHLHKVKCSGNQPCQSCISSSVASHCTFPVKERKITISESYLKKLEADSRRLEQLLQQNPTPVSFIQQATTPTTATTAENDSDMSPALSPEESRMQNPLFDGQSESRSSHAQASFVPNLAFTGEASCAAFSNRLLQCLDDTHTPPSTAGFSNYYRVGGPEPRVLVDPTRDFPDRMHAKLLLNVARRFIGNYHPLFLEVSFMREIDAVYRGEVAPQSMWLCKFYALMCLGEIYTNRRGVEDTRVPGTDYYIKAVNLLHEAYEEPSLLQVEVLTLLAWASNIFGRVRTAFCHVGTAMRLATSMGLHRSASNLTTLTPVERECRRRTWWVLYFFERFSASKLGQPVMLRDDDIDVELPSMDGLTEEERAEFLEPIPIVTNIKLGKIIGNILTDIYGIPKSTGPLCIHRVHGILKQLRGWHDDLHPTMRLQEHGTPRPVLSLHLAYNQCIVQTTRPVLLYLFKSRFQLGGSARQDADTQPPKQNFSSITLALAESCVNAAQATSRIAEGLFLDGSLATFGYWDAHHFFSAALILVISAVMKPGIATSDALETLLSILRAMKKDGNIPAVDFCERLSHIQSRVASLVAGGEGFRSSSFSTAGDTDDGGPVAGQTRNTLEGPQPIDMAWGQSATMSYASVDILGNPLIESFLDEHRGPWPESLFSEDGPLKEFASAFEEPFLFHV